MSRTCPERIVLSPIMKVFFSPWIPGKNAQHLGSGRHRGRVWSDVCSPVGEALRMEWWEHTGFWGNWAQGRIKAPFSDLGYPNDFQINFLH